MEGGLAVGGVEDGLDQKEVDAAVQKAADLLRVRLGNLVKGWNETSSRARMLLLLHVPILLLLLLHSLTFLCSGLSTEGEMESVLLVGPTAPATNRARPVSEATEVAALLASRADSKLRRRARWERP